MNIPGKSPEQVRKKVNDLKEIITGVHQILGELIHDKTQYQKLCVQLFGQMGMSSAQALQMSAI